MMISVAPKTPMSASNRSTTNFNVKGTEGKPITKIVMSKEWVLPPRPKPGRKPCDDIPSSKRKAQNRAAQRAFRERRANRVSELEEKIMEMERDRSVSEGILNNMIKTLQNENQQLKNENSSLKNDNAKLMLKLKDAATAGSRSSLSISNSPERMNSLESLFNLEPQSAVPLKRKSSSSLSTSRSFSKGEIDFTNAFAFKKQRKMPVLNDIFFSKSQTSDSIKAESKEQTPRGSIIPVQATINPGITNTTTPTATETSLSSQSVSSIPATANAASTTTSTISNNIPFESCGFCSEDTPCVCREIETEQQQQQQREIKQIRESKLKIEIEKKERELILELTKSAEKDDMAQIAKCTGNPGTCLQCRNDPLSNLFCKTIAEKSSEQEIVLPSISRNGSITSMNDTLNSGNNITNSKSHNNSISSGSVSGSRKYRLPSLESLKLNEAGKQFVPCADAYKTISHHLDIRNVGVNNIANNLQTKGMFVEVGSVVSCLRELDRKFSSS